MLCGLTTGLVGWVFSSPVFRSQDVSTPTAATAATGPPAATAQATPNVAPLSSVSEFAGIAPDIPIPQNADAHAFVGSPRDFSYLTGLSYAATLGFYRRAMEDRGWTRVDYGTRIGEQGAELQYRKGERKVTIRIAVVNHVGTVVEIEEWV